MLALRANARIHSRVVLSFPDTALRRDQRGKLTGRVSCARRLRSRLVTKAHAPDCTRRERYHRTERSAPTWAHAFDESGALGRSPRQHRQARPVHDRIRQRRPRPIRSSVSSFGRLRQPSRSVRTYQHLQAHHDTGSNREWSEALQRN
jgi:hypothetical protein